MAIEASKFTEKDELIAKFYTLRAGLSVIAEETDKIKAAENELAELEEKSEKHNKQVLDKYNYEINMYAPKTNNYELPRKSNENYLEFLKRQASDSGKKRISDYQAQLKEVENHKAGLSYAILPGIATAILGIFICALLISISESSMIIAKPLAILSVYVLPFVVGISYRKKVTEKEKAPMRAEINQKIKTEKERQEKELAKIEQDEKEKLARISQAEKEKNDNLDIYLPDVQKCKTKLNTDVIPIATAAAQSVKKAMLETSKGIITESDWANIDLLIFYLETGRADSLKEALQLVDKQRQTDQIVFSIREASSHIASTIAVSCTRLGSIIQSGFSQISNQIQANHNEAMNTMVNSFASLEGSISSSNKEMSKRISDLHATIKSEGEKIANAEHLNASLLKKVNKSSDQLVYEMKYNQKYWNS